MSPAYKRCPFCEEVFEIGNADLEPMRRHIRIVHPEIAPDDSGKPVGEPSQQTG